MSVVPSAQPATDPVAEVARSATTLSPGRVTSVGPFGKWGELAA